MGLIGSLAGSAISAVGGIAAGKTLSKGYKQQEEIYNNRINDVKSHRDNVYYADPSQNAENQAAVTNAKTVLDNSTKNAVQSNVVTGGSDESVALAKGQATQSVGTMMQNAATDSSKEKENTWNNADQTINTFSKYVADAKLGQAQAKAGSITSAASGLSSAAQKF